MVGYHTQVADAKSVKPVNMILPDDDKCTDDASPAVAAAPFAHGTVTGALSSSKVLDGNPADMYVAVGLNVAPVAQAKRPPLSLAIVIDRSGSMRGDKIAQAKRAAEGMIQRLSAADRVSIVEYENSARVILDATAMNAVGKTRAKVRIRRVGVGGGTNLHGGLELGRQQLIEHLGRQGVNRILLLSDGRANHGITNMNTLANYAQRAANRGIRITTVGLGVDYNEDLMETLAENGRGQYYFVQNADDLQGVFHGELKNIQGTVATATEVRLRPSCAGVEILEVFGYNARRDGNAWVIPMADLSGSDHRKLVARVRVPVAKRKSTNVLAVELVYRDVKKAESCKPGSLIWALLCLETVWPLISRSTKRS